MPLTSSNVVLMQYGYATCQVDGSNNWACAGQENPNGSGTVTLSGNNAFTGNNTMAGTLKFSAGSITVAPSALTISGAAVATNYALSNTFTVTLTHTASTAISDPTNHQTAVLLPTSGVLQSQFNPNWATT